MIYRFSSLLLLALLLTGCAQLPFFKESAENAVTPQESVEEAYRLRDLGQWSAAISTLEQALNHYPDSPSLQKKKWELSNQWADIKLTIEHKILIIESNALLQRLRYMEIIAKGEAGNYITKTRLMFWKQVLNQKLSDLIACGDYQLERQIDLAKLCIDLAADIEVTPEVQQRQAEIKKRKRHIRADKRLEQIAVGKDKLAVPRTKAQKTKQSQAVRKERSKRVQELLASAESALEKGDYPSAVSHLKEAVSIQPESRDFWFTIDNIQWDIDDQIEKLIQQGEVYYGYDQLEAAVSTWENVLVLNPDRRDIADRINRARKVLLNLEAIKKSTGQINNRP